MSRAGRVLLLLAPEHGSARTFTEFRAALASWTTPDNVKCVPLCGPLATQGAAALHTIVTPSVDFPDLQAAIDAVPVDEPLHRVLLKAGVHQVRSTLIIRRPVLLEGEGRCDSVLRSERITVLRVEGEFAGNAMLRNLKVELACSPRDHGASAIEIVSTERKNEPSIIGCQISAGGRWGVAVKAGSASLQLIRCRLHDARWGAVLVEPYGRIEGNDITGIGESGLVLLGGAPFVARNMVHECGGPGVVVAGECRAMFDANEIRDSLCGLKVVGKLTEIQLQASNRVLHNGLNENHQVEALPGVIPGGVTMIARACRPYPFLPKEKEVEVLLQRLRGSGDAAELNLFIRAARRLGYFAEALKAHRRLSVLRRAQVKGVPPRAEPAPCEVAVATQAWDGVQEGYGARCVSVEVGTLVEIWRRHESGWLLVRTSQLTSGWCSPHIFM